MKELLVALRTNVISDTTVSGLISDRFYPAHIATLPDGIEYPCGCFEISGGGLDKDISDFGMIDLKIWSWSSNHFEQAWDVYEAIKDVLHQQKISAIVGNTTIRVVAKETARPIQAFDETDQVYYLMGIWEARCIKV
jgi:hypothetical protein